MTDSERDAMLIELHSRQAVMLATLGRLDKALNGNGQPGLFSAVQGLEGDLRTLEHAHKTCPALLAHGQEERSIRAAHWSNWIAVAAVAIAGVGIFWQGCSEIRTAKERASYPAVFDQKYTLP